MLIKSKTNTIYLHTYLLSNEIWYSFNVSLLIVAGAPVSKSLPVKDFGKAITSLILLTWHNVANKRSKPKKGSLNNRDCRMFKSMWSELLLVDLYRASH